MGPCHRRQRELQQRKELILEKSRELFFEKGFDQVTIQDICDAVEYGRSAIYALFESKEEIYSYIYIDALKILMDLGSVIDPQGEDFDHEFMKLGDVIYRFYDEYTDYFKALSHFSTKGMIHSKIPQKIMDEKERLMAEIIANFDVLLQKGIKSGKVKQIGSEEFLRLYYSSVIGIISLYVFAEEEEDREVIRRAVMTHTEIYLRGIQA